MARTRVTSSIPELQTLTHKEAAFVVEYVRDMNASRAAVAVGYDPATGHKLKNKAEIEAAVTLVLKRRLEDSDIDAEWLLYELVDNHLLARQAGNLSASNSALATIGKLALVDAFAEEKIAVKTDQEVMERLVRGRQRARERRAAREAGSEPEQQEQGGNDGVSFL